MLKIAIIDDEEPIREMIKNILENSKLQIEICGVADSVKKGTELIVTQKPDLVLLDIKLEDGTGFDILNNFDEPDFSVVFVTAYEEYALKAFKCSALDYILKPINIDELLKAVVKSQEQTENKNLNKKLSTFLENLNSTSLEEKKIVLRTQESIHIVKITQILRCESFHNYTEFYLNDDKKLLVSKTLKEYEKLLTEFGFFRVHQSHLININYISSFEKTDGGYLVLSNGAHVPVAKRKKDNLLKIFEKM